jgi:hypothetical protein
MDDKRISAITRTPSAAGGKRPYVAPRVIDAGSLRDLTFGGVSDPVSDSGNNMMMPP